MDLHSYPPEDVLIEGAFDEYERGMQFFYLTLVSLNADIHIVDQILAFPFALFTVPGKMVFYQRVVDNFLSAGLLTVTKLTTDDSADLYTLSGFRNRVLRLIRPEYSAAFQALLRQSRFSQKRRELLEKARRLRNARVAHFAQSHAFTIPEHDVILFSELKELRDGLNTQLNALAFNTHHVMLPSEYNPSIHHPSGTDTRSDIEAALDDIARRSALLNLPEQSPAQWSHQRAILNEQQITQLNEYRIKFGLPAV